MSACVYVFMHVCIFVFMCVCMRVCMYVYMLVFMKSNWANLDHKQLLVQAP